MQIYKLVSLLYKRQEFLSNYVQQAKIDINASPSGVVIASRHHKGYQYLYRSDTSDKNRIYIPKSKIGFAKAIVQREYLEKVVKEAEKELKNIRRLIQYYENGYAETTIDNMPVGKAKLITPIDVTDEEFVKRWLMQGQANNHFRPESLIFENSKGIKMRSKSEIIISDFLDKSNIPYLYEKELKINTNHSVHPDFTILDVNNRKEIYLEHLGMMDDEDYIKNAMNKLRMYEENGYQIGKQLIVTYETSKHPLNMNQLKVKLEGLISHQMPR